MRKCLFCDSNANSLEDVWPCWITKQFRADRPSEVSAERLGVTRKWNLYQPKLAVRCVCRSCNNGWMSKLETQAQQHLQSILTGQRCRLDSTAQAMVAQWSVKTAMVLEALDPNEKREYAKEDRHRLRSVAAIPTRTSVWLAACAEPSFFMSSKNRHSGLDPQSPAAVSTTIVLAHAVLQVFTIRLAEEVRPETGVTVDVRRGPWEQATIRVWPPQSTVVSWPPPIGLNGGEGLDIFADRFVTASPGSGPIKPLSV